MAKAFELIPEKVPAVKTKHRVIQTAIPHPDSIPMMKTLRDAEPISMRGQPPIIWDHASDIYVFDKYGNKWIDFSSGVLITNAGHGHPKIVAAIKEVVDRPLLTTYCFPHEYRATYTSKLAKLLPWKESKVFLLTTGAEANEVALKLAITKGRSINEKKDIIVSFNGDFHGRTLGSQYAGGIPALKNWLRPTDQFVNVPWPGDLRVSDKSFDLFTSSLAKLGVDPKRVAGVVYETYQGGNADFAPVKYMKQLRSWCDENGVVMIADEVQAGFARCGTLFGWQNYEITPDLACFGKGISSGLPISAVVGPASLLDQYAPGSMTSTHTGNAVCVASAIANLDVILDEKLVEKAKTFGETILLPELEKVAQKHSSYIPRACGKGLVATLQCCQKGSLDTNPDLAFVAVKKCVEKGVLMFAPVGSNGASIKICPPLTITEEPLREALGVIAVAVDEAVKELYG
ncbi:MAG: aspartate aminotransferase family protein [Planctomycetota bacterium]